MIYSSGDLITKAQNGEFDIIIHGCNCFNTMGAGIAKFIKKAFPEAYQADIKTERADKYKLGTYTMGKHKLKNGKELIIINAYTQYDYRGAKPIDYKAVGRVFRLLKNDFGNKKLKFGLPKIGAGLARGDWKTIENIIDAELYDENIEVVIFDKG